MSFFRKPQEKKTSAVRQDARASARSLAHQKGKRALNEKRRGFKMPFFGGGKDKVEQQHPDEAHIAPVATTQKPAPAPKGVFGESASVILRPRITEKATDMTADANAYVFEVAPSATKITVAAGIKELYGVTPDKVHVVTIPKKRVRGRRGERGMKGGGKKAYVYLKKGDTIEAT